jgi:cAMP phosphodiesterase
MKLRVLGCSGGQMPGHRLSSFLIDNSLLIDAGSATSALSLHAQRKITDILITHIHLDHVLTLGLLADNLYGQCKSSVNIWSTNTIVDGLQKFLFNDQIWPDFTKIKSPTQRIPVLRLRRLPMEKSTRVGAYLITPVSVNHIVPSVAYFIENKTTGLLHVGDTGPTTDVWAAAQTRKHLSAVVIEASFPNRLQDVADASQHLTPQTLLREIGKLRLDVPILVTHIKPRFRAEIIKELKRLRDGRIRILEDDDLLRF